MPSLIGTGANQVPTNGLLGSMAFQNVESPRVLSLKNDGPSDLAGNVSIGTSGNPQNVALAITGEATESPAGVHYKMLNQTDVGPNPEQVPLNSLLGELAYMSKDNLVISPAPVATPQQKGSLVFQLTSDTSLAIIVRGSDGVLRSATLTLA